MTRNNKRPGGLIALLVVILIAETIVAVWWLA